MRAETKYQHTIPGSLSIVRESEPVKYVGIYDIHNRLKQWSFKISQSDYEELKKQYKGFKGTDSYKAQIHCIRQVVGCQRSRPLWNTKLISEGKGEPYYFFTVLIP